MTFELFHELLFAGGSYTFDPLHERLVQLFPEQFWSETAIVLVVAILAARHRRVVDRVGPLADALELGRDAASGDATGRHDGVSPIPIARIFGIEIRIHVSWIVILAIITVGVGLQLGAVSPTGATPCDGPWPPAWPSCSSRRSSRTSSPTALSARRRGMGGGSGDAAVLRRRDDPGREPERPADEALVAGAGPTASLLVAASRSWR